MQSSSRSPTISFSHQFSSLYLALFPSCPSETSLEEKFHPLESWASQNGKIMPTTAEEVSPMDQIEATLEINSRVCSE